MFDEESVVAERRVDFVVRAAGDHGVQAAHLGGREDDVGRDADHQRPGRDAAERLLQLLAYKRPGTPFGYPASFFQKPLQRGVVQQVHGFKLSFVKYGPVVENTRQLLRLCSVSTRTRDSGTPFAPQYRSTRSTR